MDYVVVFVKSLHAMLFFAFFNYHNLSSIFFIASKTMILVCVFSMRGAFGDVLVVSTLLIPLLQVVVTNKYTKYFKRTP